VHLQACAFEAATVQLFLEVPEMISFGSSLSFFLSPFGFWFIVRFAISFFPLSFLFLFLRVLMCVQDRGGWAL
jgi:hypothetical protein